jgi:hypothetical protein
VAILNMYLTEKNSLNLYYDEDTFCGLYNRGDSSHSLFDVFFRTAEIFLSTITILVDEKNYEHP